MKTPLNRLLDTLEGGYIIGDVKPSVLAKFIKSELLEYEKCTGQGPSESQHNYFLS